MGIRSLWMRMFSKKTAYDEEKVSSGPIRRNRASGLKSVLKSGNMEDSISNFNNGLDFTIYNANGGKVIRVAHWDEKQDRTVSNLYVITHNEKLGDELEQILTMESLTWR